MIFRKKEVNSRNAAPAKVDLSMKVIRANGDVEDRGIVASNHRDGTGHVEFTDKGPVIRFPKWAAVVGLAMLALFAVLLGHLEIALSAVVLTNAGEEWLVDKIGETVQTLPQFVDWGTGAGTAAKSDVALFTAAPESRVTATYSKVGTGAAAVAQFVATQTSAAGATITNVGFWTASSAGTLVIHADHSSTVLAAGDQIQYTLTIDPS